MSRPHPRIITRLLLLLFFALGFSASASGAEQLQLSSATPDHLAGVYTRDSVTVSFDAQRIGERQMIFELGDGARVLFHGEVDPVSYTMDVLGTRFVGKISRADGDGPPPVITGSGDAIDRFRETEQYKALPHLSRALGGKGFTGRSHPASMAIHVFALASAKAHKTRVDPMPAAVVDMPVQSDPRLHRPDSLTTPPAPQCFDQQGDPCGDDCFGMCGADCTCWTWVCGDCCVYGTCLKHDTYCSKCECGKGAQYCVLCYVPITVIFSTCQWQTNPCPDQAACSSTTGAPTVPAGQPASGSALTSYEVSGSPRVFYLDSEANVSELWWNKSAWESWNLTAMTKASPAISGSALASYEDAVFYLSGSQHVMELWWNDGTSTWNVWDLTAQSNGPAAAPGSSLSSYNYDYNHLFYLSGSQHVMELWWNGSSWISWDLTSMSGASPAAAGSALTSYTDAVFFLDANQHVIQLWWNDGNNTWNAQDLTALASAPTAAAGSSLASHPNNLVAFFDANGHLIALKWNGSVWSYQDLTSATNAPAAASGSPLAVLGTTLYFFDANQHVISVNSSNPSFADLTTAANAPIGADDSDLSTGTDSKGYPLIFYTTRSRHVFELWWNGSAWVYVDLTPGPVSSG